MLKTHEASLDAIVLRSLHTFHTMALDLVLDAIVPRSLHTMALDLVLGFLCDNCDTLIAERER